MNSHLTGIEQCTSGYINGTDLRIGMKMPSGSKSKATNQEVSFHSFFLSFLSSFFLSLSFCPSFLSFSLLFFLSFSEGESFSLSYSE